MKPAAKKPATPKTDAPRKYVFGRIDFSIEARARLKGATA